MIPIRTNTVRSRQIELRAAIDEKLIDLGIKLHPTVASKMLYDETLINLPIPRLLGLMGYLNNLIGCILIRYGAAEKVDQLYRLNHSRVEAIVSLARRNELSISIPITYTQQYLREYWPGATNHRPFLRDMRSLLSEMGLLSYQSRQPREGAAKQTDGSCKSPPSEYHEIDFCYM